MAYFSKALPQDPAQFERIFYQFVEVAAAVRARRLDSDAHDISQVEPDAVGRLHKTECELERLKVK